MTSTSLHNPKSVKTVTLSGDSIVLMVKDDEGNDVSIFFKSYEDFFSFSATIRKGGTYGQEIEI